MTADALGCGLLQANGPAVLLHLCNGFPYGPKWAPLTSGAHAVVITSVDSDAGTATFNNPWGDKDQPIDVTVLLARENKRGSDHGQEFGILEILARVWEVSPLMRCPTRRLA